MKETQFIDKEAAASKGFSLASSLKEGVFGSCIQYVNSIQFISNEKGTK